MRCLIIADDLTGACDAAGPFAARGYSTAAILLAGGDPILPEVLAISTDTRDAPTHLLPVVLAEIAGLLRGQAGIVFKKIDSTLRGNAPAEIAAAAEAFGCAAIVTPAFPAMRRVVCGGHLSIAGQPDFAPIYLPSHFASAHAAPADVLPALRAGERIVTVDAATDDDLDQVVAAGLAYGAPVLWAGSAGLSSALARSLPAREPLSARKPNARPVLFCAGSDHPVTLTQQAALSGSAHLSAEIVTPSELLAALASGRHVVLRIPRGRVAESRVRELLSAIPPLISALLVTGGDTASLLYRALGMRAIAVHGEVAPGIPYGVAGGGALNGTAIVTKSGGFGARDAFIEIADFFACPKI